MEQYRLLRNNKETGPYSAQQLISMGLKAYDLVWIEGKSAAWRYPSEVPELSAHAPQVEEQPYDRFYNRSQPQTPPAQVHSAQSEVSPALTAVPQQANTVASSKPRIRIKADWRQVETAATVQQAENTQPAVDNQPPMAANPVSVKNTYASGNENGIGWKEALNGWKDQDMLRTGHPRQPDAPVETTVKYSASLDSIKQRYEETILKPRNNFDTQQWWRYSLILLLIPLLGLGLWLGKRWDARQEASIRPPMPDASVTPAPSRENTTVLSAADLKQQDAPASLPSSANTGTGNTSQTNKSRTITATSLKTVLANPARPVKPAALPSAVANNKAVPAAPRNNKGTTAALALNKHSSTLPVRQPTIASNPVSVQRNTPAANSGKNNLPDVVAQNTAIQQPVYTAPPSPNAHPPRQQIADYISVNDESTVSDGDKNMRLHVKNLSNIPVDLVVVDLQYYDSRGRFQKGETMYVNHLAPLNEVALQAPTNKNAQKITYRVSLLSIEKKGIYLIAD